jgi:hypothetical protein
MTKERLDTARGLVKSNPDAFTGMNPQGDSAYVAKFVGYMEPLQRFMDGTPRRVVSVGVGSGVELQALRTLFPDPQTRIIGLDLSKVALNSLQNSDIAS